MIRINQLRLPVDHSEEAFKKKIFHLLRISKENINSLEIYKRSIDARKKDNILFCYTVDIELKNTDEKKLVQRINDNNVSLVKNKSYRFNSCGNLKFNNRPVIVGTGPAGLFCGLMLARAGYRPLLLERGLDADRRTKLVEQFWNGKELDTECNVQFGEGGAGTFSDGKLNTLVKDTSGRNRKVLEIFTEFGADKSILYDNKPHIGTDILCGIVKNIRNEIIRLGGEVRFSSKVTDIIASDGILKQLIVNDIEKINCDMAVLAIGHSARDTFKVLNERNVYMEPKAFAVGVRIQHRQSIINISQYGIENSNILGPASYKLTMKASSERGVYSFCMCPGGYVVDASSEDGMTAVNGMSYHDRMGENANSAIIVSVTPKDFGKDSPLAGIEFQRKLERAAYKAGKGHIPVQLYGDFKKHKISTDFKDVRPEFKGKYTFADLNEVLPEYICNDIKEGIDYFEHIISGYSADDAIIAGVESRTSSPVRIPRDDNMESSIRGLIPCGEGAGYAGGITSAAMDGIKAAEIIAGRYAPLIDENQILL